LSQIDRGIGHEEEYMQKIVINGSIGGFGVSKMVAEALELEWSEEYDRCHESRRIARDDPRLVQLVEESSEQASGNFAKLEVVEIPDGVEWQIEDGDDGREWIAEKHRTWP
jgi:fibronectin type 3 domain-containing protein